MDVASNVHMVIFKAESFVLDEGERIAQSVSNRPLENKFLNELDDNLTHH
jgi:dUTPase